MGTSPNDLPSASARSVLIDYIHGPGGPFRYPQSTPTPAQLAGGAHLGVVVPRVPAGPRSAPR